MTSALESYPFDKFGRYVLSDYDRKRPFSSFLPGIAGRWGVPMWVFYVNRGQGIASFGVESKEKPILEFQPANKAYRLTSSVGFRTFIKLQRQTNNTFYEPFAPWSPGQPRRQMHIGMNELELRECHQQIGLDTQVRYFILPGEPLAGLVRQVTIENTGSETIDLELLDGLPAVIPYGVDNGALKHVSRTIEAWMQVEHYQQNKPFYRLRASAADRAEVSTIVAGHFALGSSELNQAVQQLPVIIDPALVFGEDTSLYAPARFLDHSLDDLLAMPQIDTGKTPCAFFGLTKLLQPGESVTLQSVYGHVTGYENLLKQAPRLSDPAYLDEKRDQAQKLVHDLTETVHTQTASPRFDAYVRQTFLDNLLRGGWPVMLGGSPRQHSYYIYSRKHGDLERDYNDFFLAAEFFSHGNGNYRDVNQNRRMDVRLKPDVEAQNIRDFLSLIQLDGYNPLVIQGTSFQLPAEARESILTLVTAPEKLSPLLGRNFTPGELLKFIADHHIDLSVSRQDFFDRVIAHAVANLEADFGEGFWIDHWTYILDQIESFLAIYPERETNLFFGAADLPFYKSPAQVLPRRERYVLTEQGPRQYHALKHTDESGWVRTPEGDIYGATIFAKLVLLAGIKFGTLDPAGMGIEMEAGKPGWYDALNGLPGLFGSSMAETYELLRLIRFLRESIVAQDSDEQVALPAEFGDYLDALADLTSSEQDPFLWWDHANQLRETYRDRVYSAFSGEDVIYTLSGLDPVLELFEGRIREGIKRAETWAQEGLTPTYFRYEVDSYEILQDEKGTPRLDGQGRPYIQAKQFRPSALPPFLEGPVRALKVVAGQKQARSIHAAVQAGPLYDSKLKMYKVSASLAEQTHEIGRARAFTPGWLENESIWLHMAYKYLLGLLRAGLYQQFWAEARQGLVCFHPVERYGRSPLENSSFLVSSAHPDESLHGAGFVARLSGATAEFIHMWQLAMVGPQPFFIRQGNLHLRLRPALPGWLFDTQDQISFKFLGQVPVTYHHPQRTDTWNLVPSKIRLHTSNHQRFDFPQADLPSPYAEMVRDRDVALIEVFFEH